MSMGLKFAKLPAWARVNKFCKADLTDKGLPWEEQVKNPMEECSLADANLVTSEIAGGMHSIMLDIDMEAELVPSTTPGHHHLYINKKLTWEKYKNLLTALADAGIISEGYKQASFAKGCTALRMPWVEKAPEDMSSSGNTLLDKVVEQGEKVQPAKVPIANLEDQIKWLESEVEKLNDKTDHYSNLKRTKVKALLAKKKQQLAELQGKVEW